MANVEIYTWATCPYCRNAKALLDAKDVDYTEHKIDGNDAEKTKMTQRASGRTSVPQIFIDNKHIGGCDDLHALEEKGELDKMLAA